MVRNRINMSDETRRNWRVAAYNLPRILFIKINFCFVIVRNVVFYIHSYRNLNMILTICLVNRGLTYSDFPSIT